MVQVWSSGLEEWESVPHDAWIHVLGTGGQPHLTVVHEKHGSEGVWQVCRDHLGRYIRILNVRPAHGVTHVSPDDEA